MKKVMFLMGTWLPLISLGAENTVMKELDFNADLRVRHEFIDEEGSETRNRQRIRARVGAKGTLSPKISFGFRAASGGESITSTNQDLGNGFANKDFSIDLAYGKIKLYKDITLVAGKMKIPFFRPMKSQLFWDADVTPEGVAINSKFNSEGFSVFANTAIFALDERSTGENATLFGGQVGVDTNKRSWGQVKVGLSAYIFDGVSGQDVIFDSTKSFGNSVVDVDATATTQNQYLFGYEVYEAFIEYKGKLLGLPFGFGGDFIVNNVVDDNNTGYIGIVTFGSKKSDIPLVVIYNYRRVEADSTLGVIADSDAFGGGVDGKGHFVYGQYYLEENVSLAAGVFFLEKGLSAPIDYTRGQFDLKMKF